MVLIQMLLGIAAILAISGAIYWFGTWTKNDFISEKLAPLSGWLLLAAALVWIALLPKSPSGPSYEASRYDSIRGR